jgi:hypothetical protein
MAITTAPASNGKCPACKAENVELKDVNGLLVCEKCAGKRFSSKVRKKIEEAFERQQDQKKREAWNRRLELARKGVRHYEEGRLPEALRLFKDYISILENKYGVGVGGLTLSVFNLKKDAGEVLLIAGVYWDLVKIYDHMKGHSAEMRICLNKFIEFSIDRPHLILASEAIRKYIASKSAVNVQDFKSAQQVLHKHLAKCFIAGAVFGPASPEVQILQNFRDTFLESHFVGRQFTRVYYKMSPAIGVFIIKNPTMAKPIRLFLKKIVKILS